MICLEMARKRVVIRDLIFSRPEQMRGEGGVDNAFNAQNQKTANASAPMTYDDNGNETDFDAGYSYAYDAWNRLVVATAPGSVETDSAYDAKGRRVSETDPSSGQATHLYYSKDWQVVEERDGGGAMTVQYVWSPNGTDTLVAAYSNAYDGKWVFVQQDANGNVTSLVDTSGATVERYTYDPYGFATVLDANGDVKSGGSDYGWRYLFQGQRYDAGTDLYDFRNRAYDPYLGRFLQQDPTGYADGANLYQAMRDNPVAFVDPFGTSHQDVVIGTSGGGDGGNVPTYRNLHPVYNGGSGGGYQRGGMHVDDMGGMGSMGGGGSRGGGGSSSSGGSGGSIFIQIGPPKGGSGQNGGSGAACPGSQQPPPARPHQFPYGWVPGYGVPYGSTDHHFGIHYGIGPDGGTFPLPGWVPSNDGRWLLPPPPAMPGYNPGRVSPAYPALKEPIKICAVGLGAAAGFMTGNIPGAIAAGIWVYEMNKGADAYYSD